MALRLLVDSVPYDGFLEASVTLSMDALAHGFRFVATSDKDNLLPFKGGEPCSVLIDDFLVTTGFIELVEVTHSANSHEINIQGRSKTGDLVDSSLDALELNAPITIQTCIQRVIEQLNQDITVTDQSGSDPFNEAEDRLGPSVGENAFDFISRLAKKRQVLLNTDSEGNVLITRSEAVQTDSSLLNLINPTDFNNNILSARVSYNHMKRFNKYIVKSQLNVSSLIFSSGLTDLTSVVDQGGNSQDNFVSDDGARVGRQLVLRAEKASSTEQSRLRATWEANIRRARSGSYSATVNGFINNTGQVWELNTIVNVIDEFSDINANKLINRIEFSTSVNGGDITRLGMVETDAYQVSLDEPPEIETSGKGLFG